MEEDFTITVRERNIPQQNFNGKTYYLYPGNNYFSKDIRKMHIEVWKFYNSQPPKGYHVHHKDGDKSNNRIENLELIEAKKHLSEHGKKIFEDPERKRKFCEAGIAAAPAWHRSEAGKAWHAQHGKESWKNRMARKHTCTVCGNEFETRHAGKVLYCHQNCQARAFRARRKEQANSV